jgi:hypothetical protein
VEDTAQGALVNIAQNDKSILLDVGYGETINKISELLQIHQIATLVVVEFLYRSHVTKQEEQ